MYNRLMTNTIWPEKTQHSVSMKSSNCDSILKCVYFVHVAIMSLFVNIKLLGNHYFY